MAHSIESIRTPLQRRAFTLAELVVVVLILSIFAAVAVPRYTNAVSRFNADAAARRIKSDIEYLRHQARRTAAAKSIVFAISSHSYTLAGVADLNHPGQSYSVKLGQTPYNARLQSVNCGGDSTLIFDGFGSADSAATIIVSSGSIQKTVSVDSRSGKVTVQ